MPGSVQSAITAAAPSAAWCWSRTRAAEGLSADAALTFPQFRSEVHSWEKGDTNLQIFFF